MSVTDKSKVIVPKGFYGKTNVLQAFNPDTESIVDITTVRNTSGTIINEAGNIENVPANVPRRDHLNSDCGALLVEPQRTNLVHNSLSPSEQLVVLNNETLHTVSMRGSGSVDVFDIDFQKSGDVGTSPYEVAVDSQDNVYVACFDSDDVYVFDGTSWTKSGDVGSGPVGVAVDSQDNVYVACFGSDDVYVYDGSSWSKSGDVGNSPFGVAVDSQDNVYVACRGSDDVYVYDGTSWSKSGDVGNKPVGVAVDSQDNVYVACRDSDNVYVYNGTSWSKSGDVGTSPYGVAVDSQDNVYVVCEGSDDVYVFDGSSWSKSGDVGDLPRGVVVDSQDNVYVACRYSNDVYVYNGTSWSKSGDVGSSPRGVAVDSQDNVYVACFDSDDVYVFNDLINFGTATQSNPLTFSANDLTVKLVPNNADALQCEEGKIPTSVIETTDATATRNADEFSIDLSTENVPEQYTLLFNVDATGGRLLMESTGAGFDLDLKNAGRFAMLVDLNTITFKFPDNGQPQTELVYEKPADFRGIDFTAKLGPVRIESAIWAEKLQTAEWQAWLSGTISSDFLETDWSAETDLLNEFRAEDWGYFPLLDLSSGIDFNSAWRDNSLTSFPANRFDSLSSPSDSCFENTWDNNSIDAQGVENILVSIDTSGANAPASGPEITIDTNGDTLTTATENAITSLKSKGWTITIDGVAQ